MTYVSKKEKVFDLPVEQDEVSSLSLSNSETRLKRFPSVSDRRAWTTEECQRYQHFYSLVNGSESSLSKSSSFKYIPFDVLLAILMAEKDAYIQQLLDRQDERSFCEGKLYKAEGFEDSDDDREALIRKDAEVVALKNKIAGLESSLEDYRDTLTKAMHKLENMDAIMSENQLLREKIKYSEETIKCLEEKKKELQRELEYFKRTFESEADEDDNRHTFHFRPHGDCADGEKIIRLSSERDLLVQKVEELQKELERARTNAAEIEILRKVSETTSSSLEELSKENECYKKKLETMKCLEKHVEELKKQAHTLTDKYKRESQKANDQLKQIHVNAKELQVLRGERDALQKRVNELSTYESQYNSLQNKLHELQLIIDENDALNKKLIQLDRLELENEQLKMRIDQMRCTEIQAVEDKERIVHLQRAVVEQEEEIRKMVRQIEELSQGYFDKNEIYRMKGEIEEKNCKLKQYERQLAEIPVLESEIDLLRNKLQKCIDDFKTDKDLLKRLQEELEACQRRCHELEEMALYPSESISILPPENGVPEERHKSNNFAVFYVEKGENTVEILIEDAESQCPIKEVKEQETFVVDARVQKLEKLEEQNQILKMEVEALESKLSNIRLEDLLVETKELKEILDIKEKRILDLEVEVESVRRELSGYVEELEKKVIHFEEGWKTLKEVNEELEIKVRSGQKAVERVGELEELLRREKKAREFAKTIVADTEEKLLIERRKEEEKETITKLLKEEANIAKQELYFYFGEELSNIKSYNQVCEKLIKELKIENKLLREIKEYSDCREKSNLKYLLSKLRAEVKVLRSLSKPELQAECDALQSKVKKMLKETDSLVEEIKELKSALHSEKKAKDYLETELTKLQAELSACMTAGNEILGKEMVEKETTIYGLRKDLAEARNDLENTKNEARVLRDENVKLFNNYSGLKLQHDSMQMEMTGLLKRVEELNQTIKNQEKRQNEHSEEINILQERINNQKAELTNSYGQASSLGEKIKTLEDLLRKKDEEVESAKKTSGNMKSQLDRLNSDMCVLKTMLEEKSSDSDINYERDLEEKYALEEALRKIESQLDDLKLKVEECKNVEEEKEFLKNKKNSLLEKMADFEMEIENLKKKLNDYENLKRELEQLMAEREVNNTPDVANLYRKLEEQKTEVESLKIENETLREELFKTKTQEVQKNSEDVVPQTPEVSGFFTPPALPSPRSKTPQEEMEGMIKLETHKKEIMDRENYYKGKIHRLKEANADRIKKLTIQYEREAKCRSKAFHECIITVKTSYENDIRKLVEKHKTSIMRLQDLHEDEVQELNTNYETQMEAMQTQNENVINDLRTETAEKCKQVMEQHYREMKDLEMKYEELVKEKENRHLQEKTNVESSIKQSTNDIKEVHKHALDSLKQFYQNNIAELEEKHNKEMKKCKKDNLKRLELMKNKYEDLLIEERKKYEEQLEEMLMKLRKGHEGDSMPTELKPTIQKNVPTANPRLEFLEVLQKIINEGLESLTFEELILVHCKTCFVPESMFEDGEMTDGVGDGCRHKEFMGAEKEELLRRICTLEHEMVIKQLETHEAIVSMETAEKYRIQELKKALCSVQQENAELKRLISDQSKHQMDLKIERYMLDRQASFHETDVMQKVKEIERCKAEKKRLEEELQKERTNVKNLTATLETEKEVYRSQRKRDAEYVESMRLRLEEALNHEQIMESQLDYEARFRAKLESELQSLQKSFNLIADLPATQLTVDTKAVKDIKNFDQCETTKEVKHSRSKSKHRSKHKNSA